MLAALRKTPETLREGLRAGEPHHLPRGCSEGWGGVLGVSLSALAPNHCPSSAVEVSSTRTKRRPGCLRGRRAPPCAPCPLCSAPRAGHTSLTRPVLPRASGPGRAHRENLGSEASALSRDAPAGRVGVGIPFPSSNLSILSLPLSIRAPGPRGFCPTFCRGGTSRAASGSGVDGLRSFSPNLFGFLSWPWQ